MPRKEYKHHIFYKMTNLINDKFYYGMHSCHEDDHSNCKYKGSGTRLRYSKQKYGIENFKIEFLKFFGTRKELSQYEKTFVTLDFIQANQPLCMNIKEGGHDGLQSEENMLKWIEAGKLALKKKWQDQEYRDWQSKKVSKFLKEEHKNGNRKHLNVHLDWTDKKHTQETKNKIGLANSIRQKENPVHLGKKWINDGINSKMIIPDELESYLSNGWKSGRIWKRNK